MTESLRPTPKRLAEFEVLRRLGVGGMAEVFLAKKRGAEGTYKLLVVKRILPAHGSSRRFRTMFAEEAQLATRLNHPNIVQVYEFQDYGDEGQLLSMEYVEGPDLRKLLKSATAKNVRLPPYVAAYIVAEVAKGLHYAHERRDEGGNPLEIVHRDVSPQNVLLSVEGAVKVADFGIATANMFREEPGVLKGKTGYMSPEQARGERVDRRTDVYSLGVVFHELLTARPLHGAAEGSELLDAVRAGRAEPPSTFARGVPPELESIVMRALERDPANRYQTAREMAGAVTRALFNAQELVDSHVLETVVVTLVDRDDDAFGDGEADHDGDASASRSAALGGPGTGTRGSESGTPFRSQRPRVRRQAGREVRHVAVLRLRLHGLDALAQVVGAQEATRAGERLRATLGEIAFKRGARLTWDVASSEGGHVDAARAVVGLMANPSRAAADAAWLAVDVHEAIQGANADLPVELESSIGIVRGIASGERDRAGHLIHHQLQEPAHYLAELLGNNAPAGATLVAGGLYRLVRRDFLWGDAPTVEIASEEQTSPPRHMRIYALLRPLTREERLQEMALAPSELIGRDAELADLHSAYYSVVGAGPDQGQATARVVAGELGIGKTALVAAFLNELPPDARVLHGECSPSRSEVPFAAIGEWVRELTGTRPDQSIDEARSLIAAALGEFANGPEGPEIISRLAKLTTGRVARAIDEADDVHNRHLITSGLQAFFARAASEAPLVVVVDGLQWCDAPSLELITDLVRLVDNLPVLTILITRPDERVGSYVQGLVRVELRGLSGENQIRLLQARLGVSRGVAQVCADLLPRAAGNPFFLLEMVDAMLERGLLEIREVGEDGEQELARVERPGEESLHLPSTLEQLIADRLSELPQEEQAIIDWLAVAGGPLSEQDLVTLHGESAGDAVVRLCARGLCDHKAHEVDVRHPLTRDVAYRSLDREDRTRMHRALGERLAQTAMAKGLAAAVVARHLARGGVRDKAAEMYLEAAQAARSSYQTQLAARSFRRAISLLDEKDLRLLEAHEAMEAIYRNEGRWRERRRHLNKLRTLAKASGRPEHVAIALMRTARYEFDGGHLSKALSSAQRTEQVAESAASPILLIQAQVLTGEILRDLGDMQGALSAVDRALKTAERPEIAPRLRAEVLHTKGTLLRRAGRVNEAVDVYVEAIAVFRRVGARRMEARTKSSLAFSLYALGRFEDGVALALESIQIDLAIGGRFQIAKTLSNIGQCYSGLGDTERGLAYLKRAREAHERYGDRDSRADTLLATAEVLIEAQDFAAAEVMIGDAGALTQVTGSAYDTIHEKILRALLARSVGDASTAVTRAFEARQAAEAQAYAAFHFFAMAIEAAARAEIGEHHTGILLATTAMGALETLQGSEYGLQTRALCCEALERAGSPQAPEMRRRAAEFALRLETSIRDPQARQLFAQRAPVRELLGERPKPTPGPDAQSNRPAGGTSGSAGTDARVTSPVGADEKGGPSPS